MKSRLLIFLFILTSILHGQTSKELLRDGLFAEESEGDLKTATEKYEALLKAFEAERKVAAVALYRLAAVKRKQGEDKAALALYEEFGKKFGSIEPQATLVRENYLAISGKELPSGAEGLDEEEKELARLKKLKVTSPDLFPNLDNFPTYVADGKSKIVAYLLEEGAEPNRPRVVDEAARSGSLSMVRQLLEAGADPKLEVNWSAFSTAIELGHWQIAELMAENGANLKFSWPSILASKEAMAFEPQRINFLASHGADPNRVKEPWSMQNPNSYIGIPLHDAVRLKQYAYAKLLLDLGAEVNLARPTDGVTALHLACSQGDEKMIQILIDAGADLEARTVTKSRNRSSYPKRYTDFGLSEGKKPIDVLSVEKSPILINAGAKIGSTTLYYAVWSGDIELVDFLSSKGADVNQQVKVGAAAGKLPLDLAFSEGDDEMVQNLLSKGAELSNVDWLNLPPAYRIQVARKDLYPKFAESGKVHFVFPEVVDFEAATFPVEAGPRILSHFMGTLLPSEIDGEIVETVNDRRADRRVSRRIDYDGLTWNLIRSGKVELINLEADLLPVFAAGDIIEITGFAGFSKNAKFSNSRGKHLAWMPCDFSRLIRKASRIPIKITHAGVTHDLMICYDRMTFDARSNEVPAGTLGRVLDLIFNNSYPDHHDPTSLVVEVERVGLPKIFLGSDKNALAGFKLKSGDHISVACAAEEAMGDGTEVTKRWEEFYRDQAVSARVRGKIGAWRWGLQRAIEGEFPLTPDFHQGAETGEAIAPTLLAVLADINEGYQTQGEAVDYVAFNQLTGGKFQKVLPGIDLSRIVVHRRDGEEVKEITINLAERIVEWSTSERTSAPFDFQLQAGDIIDLTTNDGEWKGFSDETNQYFEAALNFPLIMMTSDSVDSLELNFKMAGWSQTDWGIFPFIQKGAHSSIQGDQFLSGQYLLQRDGKNFPIQFNGAYWAKSGDFIVEYTTAKLGRPAMPKQIPKTPPRYVPRPRR